SAETVEVTLTSITSGNENITVDPVAATAIVTITDDDSATVSIATTTEAAEPLTNGAFTVTLSQATETDTVVAYTIAGDALAGTDYTALSGEVTILAGQTTATIDVDVLDDTTLESAETVEVTLTSITSGNENITVDPVAATATVTITDDDSATVSIDVTTDVAEPSTNGVFTVTLSETSETDTLIAYTIAGDAVAGTDYTALSGEVIVLAGQTSALIDVTVLDDTSLENDETVEVTLTDITSGNENITVEPATATATLTISDDDSAIAFIQNGADADEPSNNGAFTVILSQAVETDTVIAYEVSGDAIADSDYVALTGEVTIPAGQTSAPIDVAVIDDSVAESAETVVITLTGITSGNENITVDPTSATVTIFEDTDAVGVIVTASGDSTDLIEGSLTDSYSVVLSSQPTADVTITLGLDEQVTTSSTEITFTPDTWNIAQDVTIEAVDDEVDQGDRTSTITHTVTSDDPNYDAFAIDDIVVNIAEDELPGEGVNLTSEVTTGETLTIEVFGGVGSIDTPNQDIVDDVDTLAFTGENLTASNLLLTQQGADLLVSFAVNNTPEVTLVDFALEDFDNLTLSGEVVGNISFDGQNNPTDELDVIDAAAEPTVIERENVVTFLNDLDNQVLGLSDSDDVINGQGGNDTLEGDTGNDLLRGGEGNDVLDGGDGDDTLEGNEGDDNLIGNLGDDILIGAIGDDNLGGKLGDDLVRGGEGNDIIGGGQGRDTVKGGQGDDIVAGGADADTLAGGSGSDTFRYGALDNSLLGAGSVPQGYDTINGFEADIDVIDAPDSVIADEVVQASEIATLNAGGIGSVLTSETFVANGAATFTFGTRTFVALNDSVDGYQVDTDAVIEISDYTGSLSNLTIV
ncbi:MAG: Calx-beta domain-containing protein, partial [Cyanobacteria bacterium P01_F01_bin.86]